MLYFEMVAHAEGRVRLEFTLMFELDEEGRVIRLLDYASEEVVLLLVDSEVIGDFFWDDEREYLALVMDYAEALGVSELLEEVAVVELEINKPSFDLEMHLQEEV